MGRVGAGITASRRPTLLLAAIFGFPLAGREVGPSVCSAHDAGRGRRSHCARVSPERGSVPRAADRREWISARGPGWTSFLPPLDAFGTLVFQVAGQQLSVSSTRAIILSSATRPQENQPRTRLVLVGGPERARLACGSHSGASTPGQSDSGPPPIVSTRVGRLQQSLAGDRRLSPSPETKSPRLRGFFRWAHLGSNQGPPACEAGALPLSYAPQEGSV
jgi:hypothetical protein